VEWNGGGSNEVEQNGGGSDKIERKEKRTVNINEGKSHKKC